MSHDLKLASLADATRVLHLALTRSTPMDVVLPNEKAAIAFRFRLYSAKKKEIKTLAAARGVTASEVRGPYDRLHMTIHPFCDDDEEPDPRHVVRITPVDMVELDIRDTATGEQLEMFPEPEEQDLTQPEHDDYDDSDFSILDTDAENQA